MKRSMTVCSRWMERLEWVWMRIEVATQYNSILNLAVVEGEEHVCLQILLAIQTGSQPHTRQR